MTKKRNIAFDVLRVLATILVVYQHACGNTAIEKTFEAFAKIAVPLFLMITGFYYSQTRERSGQIRQMKKIFSYAFSITILYFCIEFMIALIRRKTLFFLQSCFSLESIKVFLLFNNPYVGSHAWYLWSLFYVLVLLYVLEKVKIQIPKKTVTLVLWIGSLILGIYAPIFLHQKINYLYYRNFLFIGLPCVLLGNILYEQRESILKMKKIWPILTLISILLGFLEYFVLTQMGIPSGGYYIFTTVIAVCMFAFCMSTNFFDSWEKVAQFGQKHSLNIYAFHVEVVVFEKRWLPMEQGFGFLGFILVLLMSILISVCFEKGKKGAKEWFAFYKNSPH